MLFSVQTHAFALTGIVRPSAHNTPLSKVTSYSAPLGHNRHREAAGRLDEVKLCSHIIVREGQAAQTAARADIARVDGAAAAEFNHQVTACVHISVGDGNAILAVFTVFTIIAAADAARVVLRRLPVRRSDHRRHPS